MNLTVMLVRGHTDRANCTALRALICSKSNSIYLPFFCTITASAVCLLRHYFCHPPSTLIKGILLSYFSLSSMSAKSLSRGGTVISTKACDDWTMAMVTWNDKQRKRSYCESVLADLFMRASSNGDMVRKIKEGQDFSSSATSSEGQVGPSVASQLLNEQDFITSEVMATVPQICEDPKPQLPVYTSHKNRLVKSIRRNELAYTCKMRFVTARDSVPAYVG